MTLEPSHHGDILPLVPVGLDDDDMAGLADIIGGFLAVMRRQGSGAAGEQPAVQAALDRLEQVRTRLLQEGKSTLLMEDLLTLDAALMLFSIYLLLECPPSEQREAAIDGFWTLREHLSTLRRSQPPGLN